ncbi:MAG: GTP-binding protein [Patescibacteria group bacterium]|nr:GTP-binding protein [Patescibacteria group bacterium]
MVKNNNKNWYPPVVAVLGHVDHGKTTLLDAIRKTSVAQREHGGITQKIGASKIDIVQDGNKKSINFIDTPGHEAFSKMRSRGAIASDIGLLIVSSVDGVMPQTREGIGLLKASSIPYIVVLTKADLPTKNSEKVKQQLLKEEVMVEGYGGQIPVIEVSAKTGENVKELLDLILLVYELNEKLYENRSESNQFKAIVIESKLDQRSGPKATIVIKDGTVNQREELISDPPAGGPAKVKTIINDKGEQQNSATVGMAVEILGFQKVPAVGSIIYKKDQVSIQQPAGREVETIDKEKLAGSLISVILRTDTEGSLEAITNSLAPEIFIISQKTGEITPADILLAKSTGSIIIGFNIKVAPDVLKQARTEKVLLKNYSIIYELLDELKDAMEGKILSQQEEIYGRAKVLASFPYEKTKVLGIAVLDGRVAKGDKVRIERKDEVIGESFISSARQGKNQVSKIEKGQEGGVIISPQVDFTIGDMVICIAR